LTAADEFVLFSALEQGMTILSDHIDGEVFTDEQDALLVEAAKAHRTIFLSNLRLVVNIAKKYSNFGIPLIDVIQDGNIGLTKGIARFDIHKGFKFSTYATSWVRQEITRAIGDRSRLIRVPIHNHEKWIDLKQGISELEIDLGRVATEEEIAEATGYSVKQVRDLLRVGEINIPSLDQHIGDGETEMMDSVADSDGSDFNDEFMHFLDTEKLNEIFQSNWGANDREKIVLSMRYGVYVKALEGVTVTVGDGRTISYEELMEDVPTTDGLTLEVISQIFGVTRERIRQLEKNALETFRSRITGAYNG
jgi:RNA polymerase primary sigma factor